MKLSEVTAAIRKNGLPKIRSNYLSESLDVMPGNFPSFGANLFNSREKIMGGCAIGQASLNLNIHPNDLTKILPPDIEARILHLNDYTDLSLPEIADTIDKEFGEVNIKMYKTVGYEA